MSESRRIGLLGGTFDPIHVAHLHVAACAMAELALDEVRFLPAGTPPHKPGRPISPAADRLRMTELATSASPGFVVDPIDLRTEGPSYTSELLERMRADRPNDELWFIIGADSLAELHTWHQPVRILELARLAVAARPGWDVAEALATSLVPGLGDRVDAFASVPIDLSATMIRTQVGAGLPIDWVVPAAVGAYIHERGLYRSGDEPS